MIRLTILYNLPPGSSEEEFLSWRLSDHQEANMSVPGVISTDFSRVIEEFPQEKPVHYRFQTNMDWPDFPSFKKGFYDPKVQADLKNSLLKIADPLFLISEVLIEQKKENK
jgi:hypothetical protein